MAYSRFFFGLFFSLRGIQSHAIGNVPFDIIKMIRNGFVGWAQWWIHVDFMHDQRHSSWIISCKLLLSTDVVESLHSQHSSKLSLSSILACNLYFVCVCVFSPFDLNSLSRTVKSIIVIYMVMSNFLSFSSLTALKTTDKRTNGFHVYDAIRNIRFVCV